MVTIYTEEKFKALQKKANDDLTLTPDNIQKKNLDIPVLHSKYLSLYLSQRKILKQIEGDINREKRKKFNQYKFNHDVSLNNITEINLHIDGDEEMIELCRLYHNQEGVVEFLKNTVSQFSKMGFAIKSHIEFEKLRNGIIN